MARDDDPQTTQPDEPAPPTSPSALPRTLDASELLGEGRVLHIEHNGELYTLRITRNDRLILTK